MLPQPTPSRPRPASASASTPAANTPAHSSVPAPAAVAAAHAALSAFAAAARPRPRPRPQSATVGVSGRSDIVLRRPAWESRAAQAPSDDDIGSNDSVNGEDDSDDSDDTASHLESMTALYRHVSGYGSMHARPAATANPYPSLPNQSQTGREYALYGAFRGCLLFGGGHCQCGVFVLCGCSCFSIFLFPPSFALQQAHLSHTRVCVGAPPATYHRRGNDQDKVKLPQLPEPLNPNQQRRPNPKSHRSPILRAYALFLRVRVF